MGELMAVEEGASVQGGFDLPLFYMNDFSVLGLVVRKLSRALSVLEANGFYVARQDGCARIRFDNRLELNRLFETLGQHRIVYGTADLVSHAYQG